MRHVERRTRTGILPLFGVLACAVAACNEDALPPFGNDGGTAIEAGIVDLRPPPDLSLSTADLAPGCFALFVDECGGWAEGPASRDYDPFQSLTVEAWVWILRGFCGDAFGPHPVIVGHGYRNGSESHPDGYALAVGEYPLSLMPGGLTGGSVPDGRWSHVAGVYDSATNTDRLFIDGVQVARGPGFKPMSVTAPLYIASDVGGGGSFHGWVAEVRVTSGARYLDAFTPERRFTPDPYTLALYHFDEPEGLVAHDSSRYGNHANLVNGARFAPPPACR